ncbi:MAG: cation transporter [Actinobacteria bacterium]|nr:cation transporter [Actinomycetota bacterium]
MSLGHDHDQGHDHRVQNRRALGITLALTGAFTIAEVIGGILTGSLALLADAAHMLSDDLSLALALGASWLASRPAAGNTTFGYQRAEVLAAFVNGLTLVAISAWIFWEAYKRLSDPPEVLGGWMLAVAAAGLLVNVVAAWILWRSGGESLNVEAALRHVLADLLASTGVIVAAVVILTTGWLYADPLVSVLVGLVVLASSWGVIRDSGRILLEASPKGIDAQAVGSAMAAAPGVREVHDLHIWTITSGFPALSAHVLVPEGEDCHGRRLELDEMLERQFGIAHTTLQVEHSHRGELLQIEDAPPATGNERGIS